MKNLLYKSQILFYSTLMSSTLAFAEVNTVGQFLTREQVAQNGISGWLKSITGNSNAIYVSIMVLSFLVGVAFFASAWMRLKKEKEKPEEQQETSKFYLSMGIGVVLMALAGVIAIFGDGLGLGSQVGKANLNDAGTHQQFDEQIDFGN